MNRNSHRFGRVRAQQGVALLECLMAMLIFSFGLLGLLGLEAKIMTFSTTSENRNRAAMFASELASQMWLSGTVTPNAPVTASTPAYLALLATVNDQTQGGVPSGAVTVVPVLGTTNAADITVTWQEIPDAVGNLSTLTTRVILP
jgi:type IV pilus assembly protein PilV